jgi:hypothetical protein
MDIQVLKTIYDNTPYLFPTHQLLKTCLLYPIYIFTGSRQGPANINECQWFTWNIGLSLLHILMQTIYPMLGLVVVSARNVILHPTIQQHAHTHIQSMTDI